MVNHLGDHRDLPLLFGTMIKGEQLMVVTQFHGKQGKVWPCPRPYKEKEKGEI